uniref:Uncharacterized protein n=1 Tax=Rhizophora mucronata TaxID=61149 RepID=A0A2P2PZU0_RHIMU
MSANNLSSMSSFCPSQRHLWQY